MSGKNKVGITANGSIPLHTAYRDGVVYSVVGAPVEPGTIPTSESFSDADESKDYQPWGDDNLWPVKTREKLQESTTAYPLIAKTACMMYGKGPAYYKEVRTKDGKTADWTPISEVDDFFANNNIPYFLMERLMDYKTYGNIFAEFILNKAGNAVASLYHKEAEFSRFGTIKDKSIIDIKYNSDWSNATNASPIPFLMRRDRYTTKILEKFKSGKKFAIHSSLPSPGSTLYAKPPHIGLVGLKGWLDYANSIPKLMNAINDNAMMLKYHIQIPITYWPSRFKDWDTLDPKKQLELMNAEFDKMDEFLKGKDKAGSSFITHFAVDQLTGKETVGWKITALDDHLKRDQFLTSVQEADVQISRALGMDVSLAGIQPAGGKMGSGSGSDKRTAFTNTISMSHAEQMIIMEPLELVKTINGWDPNIRFVFEHDIPTTLNENKDGVKSSEE